MNPKLQTRDIVVIGASAGGLNAASSVISRLPHDFPAAVFVVLHMAAGFSTRLPELLSRGALRANYGIHGEAIVPGRVYVAPADNHLMLRSDYLQVLRGPRENGHRPSVDALFRTASTAYGSRVIGVVLTGYLDCGTAGLLSIKARAGIAIAQDPNDAAVPDMPQSAIKHAPVDHVVPVREMPQLLQRLVREPAPPRPGTVSGAVMELEGEELGTAAELVCPICQGKVTEAELAGFQLFRCHVGHAFSLESLVAEQAEEVERALWAAARSLEESARLSERLANRTIGDTRKRFEEKARAQEQNVQVIRRILLAGGTITRPDARAVNPSQTEERNPQGNEPVDEPVGEDGGA